MMTPSGLWTRLMDSLIQGLKRNYEDNKCFTEDDFVLLYSTFGDTAEKALGILEKSAGIIRINLKDSCRYIYQVQGSKNNTYCLFPDVNFCQCPAYMNFVVCKKREATCKHILACKLAEITNKVIITEVDLPAFMELQKELIDFVN